MFTIFRVPIVLCFITAKLREVKRSYFKFQTHLEITFAILKNPFANPLNKGANLLMEFAMFLS